MYDIICNPVSGKGSSLAALEKVENILKAGNIPYEVHLTEKPMHATELTREINRKPHAKLIVMGGDGTLNEVLNGIENFDTLDLGIISCGTGNDFYGRRSFPPTSRKRSNLYSKATWGISIISSSAREGL